MIIIGLNEGHTSTASLMIDGEKKHALVKKD